MSAIIPLSTGISKKLQICGLLNPIQSESYEILSNFAVAYLSGGPHGRGVFKIKFEFILRTLPSYVSQKQKLTLTILLPNTRWTCALCMLYYRGKPSDQPIHHTHCLSKFNHCDHHQVL